MEEEARLVKLGWELLEHRVRYYHLDAPTIDDYQYDMLEKQYIEDCKAIGIKETISNMVGIDITRPAIQLIIGKLRNDNT